MVPEFLAADRSHSSRRQSMNSKLTLDLWAEKILLILTSSLEENSCRSFIANNSANSARVLETEAFPAFSCASFRNWRQLVRRL